MKIEDLKPELLWRYFAAINAIPRPSGHEEGIRRYILDEANRLGLWAEEDEAHNILVRKPARTGKEDAVGVILQSHLDMVAQKNEGIAHDFTRDGIAMIVEGDFVRAQGTTLGADDGLGVAAALAVLADQNLEHGPLEALFTATEECGMHGAKGLRKHWLQGSVLLNLDSEVDGELCIGCAGGVDFALNFPLTAEKNTRPYAYRLGLSGLAGGHSGLDIIRQRGNANLLLLEVLAEWADRHNIQLAEARGGTLRNAIPREASAVFVGDLALEELQAELPEFLARLRAELPREDAGLALTLESCPPPSDVLPAATLNQVLAAVTSCPQGVLRMSLDLHGLVETSSNLATLELVPKSLTLSGLVRSFSAVQRAKVQQRMENLCLALGGSATFEGEYPGWQPLPQQPLVQLMKRCRAEIFGEEATISAIHAGLECGILGERYPHWQMVSLGPTIYGAHSPDERADIASVARFWQWLCAGLAALTHKF